MPPIRRIEYVDQPLVMRRYTPDTSRQAALIQRGGEQLADLSLRKGASRAQLFERLGAIFSGYQEMERNKQATAAAMGQREKERSEDRSERELAREAERQARVAERQLALRATAEAKAESEAKDLAMDTPVGPISDTDPKGRVLAQLIERFPSLAGRFGTTPRLESTPLGMGQEVEAGPLLTRTPTGVESRQMATDAAAREREAKAAEDRRADNERQAARDAEAARHARVMEGNAAQTNARLAAAATAPAPAEIEAPADPNSQDIMGHAGLSRNGFLALTNPTSLPRDKATRAQAAAEVQKWAATKGVDVSTFQSQFKAYNEVLENNIQRFNRTVLAEGEIAADVDNLLASVKTSNLGDVRAINAAKQWLKGELNDPSAAEYAFYLNQLTNDIALYNAASQGRAALQADLDDAKSVVQRGVATGSLQGMQKAIKGSVEKMGTVLEGALNRSRKNVWDLFGVGDKFKPVTRRPAGGGKDAQPGDVDALIEKYRQKPGGGQ